MVDARLSASIERRNPVSDWTIRNGVAAFYLVFGSEKFSAAETHWVKLFQEIGAGNWLRCFTGLVEILGGLLVLIPQTAVIGLAVLSAMLSAALILLVLLHRPGDAVFPAIFFVVLAALAWNRYRSRREGRQVGSWIPRPAGGNESAGNPQDDRSRPR